MKNETKSSDEKQYDCFAREFQNADEQFPDITRPLIYDLLDQKMLPKARLLDIGCGYGKDLAHFNKQGCETYGIDISSEMLKLAREIVPQAHLDQGSFENLPYKDNYFDFVFSRYAIQHSHNVEGVLKETHRVLKEGGDLVFLVTHPMRHYFEKKTKDYWVQEDIPSVILGGKLTVCEPSHILSEYLSPFTLSNFTLEEFQEKHDPAARTFEG